MKKFLTAALLLSAVLSVPRSADAASPLSHVVTEIRNGRPSFSLVTAAQALKLRRKGLSV